MLKGSIAPTQVRGNPTRTNGEWEASYILTEQQRVFNFEFCRL